ncbi:rhamnulokinase [Streptosporangiaceae bacterium NEAU-GS5]|nr:rhamnulokinase [Streptosporangiaceae bacterium NEAU-GS5]
MRARVGPDTLDLTEVARFPNVPVRAGGTLHWDALRLYRGILEGLRDAGPVDSIGVDSWGVDFGLLDGDGRLLGNPVHYRDGRTDGVMDEVLRVVPPRELYTATGLQLMPINTLFQLFAARDTAQYAAARTMLLIPDLMAFWLTGEAGSERTNASTTQLLDVVTGTWAGGLAQRLGLRPGLFAPLREPGSVIGSLTAGVAEVTGQGAVPVTAVGSHDTASAVVGVPARGRAFGYISCGTWSLVGVELGGPVLTEESRAANFTNEAGVDGTIRYLRNVMGLWLLQESMRQWRADGLDVDLPDLLREAAALPGLRSVIDTGDPAFLPPGDMPGRIVAACRRTGEAPPAGPAETVRCILDSIALAHRAAIEDAQRLSGIAVDVVHVVGGGARNELLCRLTADACGLPVEAGPQEATALGNALVQARSLGVVGDDLDAMRALVRATSRVTRYEPSGPAGPWSAAASRTGIVAGRH